MAAMPEPVKTAAEPIETVPKQADNPEISKLKAEIKDLKESLVSTKGHWTKAKQRVTELETKIPPEGQVPKVTLESQSAPIVATAPSVTASSVPASAKKNRSWQLPYCPGPEWCGDPEHHSKGAKNTDFKDEVACADCHTPLGPEEDVKHRMESCPFCSSERGYEARQGYSLKHDRCEGGKCSVK